MKSNCLFKLNAEFELTAAELNERKIRTEIQHQHQTELAAIIRGASHTWHNCQHSYLWNAPSDTHYIIAQFLSLDERVVLFLLCHKLHSVLFDIPWLQVVKNKDQMLQLGGWCDRMLLPQEIGLLWHTTKWIGKHLQSFVGVSMVL
eukprot:TRINITY_DN79454_c0_g1_i1.p1 TRINITY_DN79454_c0_g1~~TRINITY_DN79454_c0_g1_i1.p1  ORF type:complete len:146 (+),score=11.79 TRINITY_DN79454_c0_g1_i1:41-478(+)